MFSYYSDTEKVLECRNDENGGSSKNFLIPMQLDKRISLALVSIHRKSVHAEYEVLLMVYVTGRIDTFKREYCEE
jgi:hypothetical protein